MDHKFTEKLQKYMQLPEEERDLITGATLLLQLNRNRTLYANIMRRPDKHKERLFHELNKHLKIRLNGQTIQGIVEMEKKVPEIIRQLDESTDKKGKVATGKRADHDQLPPEVQACWVENGTLVQKMRSIHERLKLMGDAEPCDRFEILQELVKADERLRQNWATYDACKVVDGKEGKKADPEETPAEMDANTISSHRKYLSTNKKKLAELNTPETLTDYTKLLGEMQTRYDELMAAGVSVSDKQKKELGELGLKI